MATANPSTERSRPPEWVFKRVINPTMKFILRSPLHGLLSNGLAILRFRGRKTGRQYSTPVAYHVEDERTVWVFTRSKWWKNLQNGETFSLRIQGRVRQATAEIIKDQEAVWAKVQEFAEQKYDNNYRRVGVMLGDDASKDEIRAEAADMLAVKATLHA